LKLLNSSKEMKKTLTIILAVFLTQTGCVTSLDKRAMTTIDISEDGQMFIITESWSDTQKSSEELINRWISEYITDNKLCVMRNIEKVSARDIVVDKTAFGITVYKRHHRFKCKD
jgi:hypothetical protein